MVNSSWEHTYGGVLNFSSFFFNNCIVPLRFLPQEMRVTFPTESQLQQNHATRLMVHAGCFSVSIILQTLDTGYGIFIVRSDVNTCDCTQGCTDTIRVCTESWLWGEKFLAAPGNRTCVDGVPVRCSTNWATSPPLGQNLVWFVWDWLIDWLIDLYMSIAPCLWPKALFNDSNKMK